jgi:hypothetical protein
MSDGKFDIGLVSLDEITINNATLENSSGQPSIDLSTLDIKFGYELNPAISLRSKHVQIPADFAVRATRKGSDRTEITSRYSIVFLFAVQNLAQLAIPEERVGLTVDDDMLSSLLNITYSTSRGILYTRYLGTPFQGLILPVIPTTELFELPSGIKLIPAQKSPGK